MCSQNASDTTHRNDFEKYGANTPVHNEGDNAIAPHHKSMISVQSHIGQEEGRTTILDNISMSAPAQVKQNTMELTASSTQVTTHTHNSMNTYTKNN